MFIAYSLGASPSLSDKNAKSVNEYQLLCECTRPTACGCTNCWLWPYFNSISNSLFTITLDHDMFAAPEEVKTPDIGRRKVESLCFWRVVVLIRSRSYSGRSFQKSGGDTMRKQFDLVVKPNKRFFHRRPEQAQTNKLNTRSNGPFTAQKLHLKSC